jgi:hypothetical protein
MESQLIVDCKHLLEAYRTSALGDCRMPEDSSPDFRADDGEKRLVYFTLPMSLNYQRDSYKLWEAALRAYQDPDTNDIFSIEASATMPIEELRRKLLKHKVALQPNKHIHSWRAIAQTIHQNWGSVSAMFGMLENDFLRLKQVVQKDQKKGFPYLSGPKIFNYWSFVMSSYGGIPLKHREWVDIAPDTHITKCSVRLGVITQQEADTWPREKISARWRERLGGSGIDPIVMHPPLWFWSRNNFSYKLPREKVC